MVFNAHQLNNTSIARSMLCIVCVLRYVRERAKKENEINKEKKVEQRMKRKYEQNRMYVSE